MDRKATAMVPLKMMIVFFAKPSDPHAQSAFWPVNFEGSIGDAILAAKATFEAKDFPLAERYEISDHEGLILYKWPPQKP
jgi:hypothetical protein